jgi:hypothetical protein
MKATNFQYGERTLSSFGMILCHFNSGGLETISGAEITFNTVPTLGGLTHELVNVEYEQCLEATFQICKHPCNNDTQEITALEYREISKWLSRRKFLKLKILDESSMDLYYMAAFTNISRIELDGKLYGLELHVITNRPHALKEPQLITINNTVTNGVHSVNDISQEEGFIYPYTEIAVNRDGDLSIYNALEDRYTNIKNCKSGEVITMDYPVIKSSLSTHQIQNDFNWKFLRISNSYDKSRNDLTISLPCTIKMKYSPIVKVGL